LVVPWRVVSHCSTVNVPWVPIHPAVFAPSNAVKAAMNSARARKPIPARRPRNVEPVPGLESVVPVNWACVTVNPSFSAAWCVGPVWGAVVRERPSLRCATVPDASYSHCKTKVYRGS
jgi:hypothetical protein